MVVGIGGSDGWQLEVGSSGSFYVVEVAVGSWS